MSEQTEDTGARPEAGGATIEDRDYVDILKALAGKVVTIVNPESYEAATVGHTLTTGFYRGKVLHVGIDYITLATEFVHKTTTKEKEPVRQYLPIASIKRISLMRTERLIHL